MPSSHPYYPLGADVVGYSPNQSSVLEILISAGGGCAALLALTFAVASYVQPTLRLADRIAILWFVLCMTCKTENRATEWIPLTTVNSGNPPLFL